MPSGPVAHRLYMPGFLRRRSPLVRGRHIADPNETYYSPGKNENGGIKSPFAGGYASRPIVYPALSRPTLPCMPLFPPFAVRFLTSQGEYWSSPHFLSAVLITPETRRGGIHPKPEFLGITEPTVDFKTNLSVLYQASI